MGVLIRFDPEADALYASLRDRKPGDVVRTQQLDECRLVDYDADGRPLGIEFLNVSDGLNLRDVPDADEIERAVRALPRPAPAA